MIPKVIHYCWFGGKGKPEAVRRMIRTWKLYCPDYQLKEWNETNFDIHINRYCREAYEQRKWAFVSDVARMYALYNEGGIYMDTDVEVVRSLDSLLDNPAFLGFEGTKWIATSILGTEPNNPVIRSFMDSYNSRSFVREDGSLDQTTNVEEWTKLLVDKFGLQLNGKKQCAAGFNIFPADYFTPYDYLTGRLHRTDNTYTIHWFGQSWINNKPWRTKLSQWYHRLRGIKME